MNLRTLAATAALCSCLVFAQGNSEEARLQSLNGQTVRLLAQFKNGDDNGKSQARAQAAEVLAQRQQAMAALLEHNPNAALLFAFPSEVLAELAGAFPGSALEERGSWVGRMEVAVQDEIGGKHKEIYRLHGPDGDLPVVLAGAAPPRFQCNDRVEAAGVKTGGVILASETNLVEAANATCSTTGPQKIAVIRVNMPGYPVNDPTEAELRGIFLGNAASGESISPDRNVSDFWSKSSDGKTWVNASGAGALTVVTVNLSQNMAYCTCTANGCSNNSDAVRQAAYAAADSMINYADFSRIALILPHNGTCNGIAGVASLGCWFSESPGDGQSNVSWTWLRADQTNSRANGVMLVTHEMGHNQGMSHAGSRDHGGEVIGPVGSAGSRSEYGDVFGTMGNWNYGLYNAPHSVNNTGWMNGTNVTTVTSSGVYNIAAFDTQGGAVKALKIRRGPSTSNAWFWVAYYPATGLYLEPLADQIHTAAIIHAQDSATPSAKTDLLDFTPASGSGHSDPGLALGQCWQDPYTDVRLCVTNISNGMLTMSVDYSLPPCTNANPTVAFLSADLAKSTAAGAGAQFRVQVTNNDSSSCGSRTFSVTSSAPSGTGWSTSISSNPSLAPGASSTVTITKTPSTAIAPGTYAVSASASAAFNSGQSGTSTGTANPQAALTVLEPAPSAPAAPSSVSVSVSQTGAGKNKTFQSYTVQWTDNASNETGFELRRCIQSGKGRTATCTYDGWSATAGTNATSYSSSVKPASGSYRFEVRAVNGNGPSAWAESGNVSIP